MLGGASCLHDDIAAYTGPVDGVVAANDAGAEWTGDLDGWCSLHPQNFTLKKWLEKRTGPPAARIFGHSEATSKAVMSGRCPDGIEFTDYQFPGQHRSGSSGLFAAKVALIDLGFDRAVLCGVPMDPRPHFFDRDPWTSADGFRSAWLSVPQEYRDRMRSMSGWTLVLLGAPKTETKEKPDAEVHGSQHGRVRPSC